MDLYFSPVFPFNGETHFFFFEKNHFKKKRVLELLPILVIFLKGKQIRYKTVV